MRIRVASDRFDTELLGQQCFKIHLSELGDLSNLGALADETARLSQADLILLSTEHEPTVLAQAQELGFRMVTTRNVYGRATDPLPDVAGAAPTLANKAVLRARFRPEAFSHLVATLAPKSRYWKDPRISREGARAAYDRWFYNSIYEDYADECVAALEGDRIVGLVTMKHAEDAPFIDLTVTADDAQGKGIGAHLVRAAIAYCAAAGFRTIKVETDGENVEANRFYQRLGFVLDSHTLALHRHKSAT